MQLNKRNKKFSFQFILKNRETNKKKLCRIFFFDLFKRETRKKKEEEEKNPPILKITRRNKNTRTLIV